MLIRVGYEITFDSPAPVAMVLLLYLHPSRESTVRKAERLMLQPSLPISEYFDAFGNRYGRIYAPPGASLSTEPKIGPSITKPISELESPSVSTVATAGNQQTAAAPFSPARKAWVTMRQRYTPEQIRARAQAAAKKAHETMRKKKGLSANESVMSPVTSKPASRGRIKTSHLEALYSKQVS